MPWDYPGSPMVKTLSFNAGGAGSIPGQEVKIPLALSQKKKPEYKKQKQCCSNKDFKNDSYILKKGPTP